MLTLLFCLLIYLVGLYKEECIIAGDGTVAEMTSEGQVFSALFSLSWTTISTVGYGNTGPSLSSLPNDPEEFIQCPAINSLLMIEAFVGVCFQGACGAILFGKIAQVKSQAQVQFSQPMVVRFGTGLANNDDGDDGDDDEEGKNEELPKSGIPCPILEFRVVNKLHNISNGVITNATICCAVGIHEILEETEDDDDDNKEPAVITNTIRSLSSNVPPSNDKITRVKLPKKVHLDLRIVNNEHPHFKRCWTAIHILDHNSPLLSQQIRSRIKKKNGNWPNNKPEYNTAQYIRDSIKFEEIIVSFNGVSKNTSCEVNAQHVYDQCDIAIGYQFVPLLEKVGNDIKVEIDCLNDVMDQNGSDKALDMNLCPDKKVVDN